MSTDYRAYCWGQSFNGELGDGNSGIGAPDRTTPVPVAGGILFKAVSAGEPFSCGLTPEGRAYCWGDNTHGQLGNGTSGGGSNTPVPVADPS